MIEKYLCGMTFAPFVGSGRLNTQQARESLKTMKERLCANFVILAPNGVQETPQSETICYTSKATMTDD